jgi:hypothetical protein
MDHRYIKFLDYVVEQKSSFSLDPGFLLANMSESEFELIRDAIFYRENLPESISVRHQSLYWTLKPEALFGYLTFKQYQQAVDSSKRAMYFASASLVVAIVGLAINFVGAI